MVQILLNLATGPSCIYAVSASNIFTEFLYLVIVEVRRYSSIVNTKVVPAEFSLYWSRTQH